MDSNESGRRGRSSDSYGDWLFDHMLHLMCRHGFLDMELKCGDLDVDNHHTVEDIGICIGQALKAAVGDKKDDQICNGIYPYG